MPLSGARRGSCPVLMVRRVACGIGGVTALAVLAVAAWGCARPAQVILSPDALRGASSLEFVSDPANPARQLPPNTQFHPPQPIEKLAVPEYPAGPLQARAGSASVGVRFVVNTEGRVVDIGPSPLVQSSAGPYLEEFRGAAEAAVATWLFQPAWVAVFEDGPDRDGDGKPDYRVAASIERVPVYLDARIDFEIVDGRGKVRIAGGSAER